MEETPPYSTEDVLDYYTRLDFDMGVSVDHLIVTATEAQKQFRYDLTIHNAEDFLKQHRAAGLKWEPIGSVQGWDPKSYAEAARQYVAMGYKRIALGGLVRTRNGGIFDILEEIRGTIPESTDIHIFGVARLDALPVFSSLGVTSVDSASSLRMAWMRTTNSYLTEEGPYAALRIPEAGKSFRAKRMREHPELSESRIQELERNALDSVRAYGDRGCSLDTCVEALLEYDQYVTSERIDMESHYRHTLEQRPWERCTCAVCQKWGIEVAIFRGNNRNRRRGFHNTCIYYRQLQDVLQGKDVMLPNGKMTDYACPKQPLLFDDRGE